MPLWNVTLNNEDENDDQSLNLMILFYAVWKTIRDPIIFAATNIIWWRNIITWIFL